MANSTRILIARISLTAMWEPLCRLCKRKKKDSRKKKSRSKSNLVKHFYVFTYFFLYLRLFIKNIVYFMMYNTVCWMCTSYPRTVIRLDLLLVFMFNSIDRIFSSSWKTASNRQFSREIKIEEATFLFFKGHNIKMTRNVM